MADSENIRHHLHIDVFRVQLSNNRTFGESWMYIFLGLYNLWVARLVERWKLPQKKSWGIWRWRRHAESKCNRYSTIDAYDHNADSKHPVYWNSKFKLFECEAGFRSSSSSRHSAYSFTNAEANAYTDNLIKYGSISHSISYHAETRMHIR